MAPRHAAALNALCTLSPTAQARCPVQRRVQVPNLLGALPLAYSVLCDLDCLEGPDTLACTSARWAGSGRSLLGAGADSGAQGMAARGLAACVAICSPRTFLTPYPLPLPCRQVDGKLQIHDQPGAQRHVHGHPQLRCARRQLLLVCGRGEGGVGGWGC
jgi:hypothetical protein